MKTVLKIFLGLVILLVVLVAGGLIYFNNTFPKVNPPAEVHVAGTPEQIVRGEYLANHVALCMDCHAKRDWSLYAGPIMPGTKGAGGEEFPPEMGLPGRFFTPNITPASLSEWTDGEIIRTIREGVTKDGKVLFPLMPYPAYRYMSDEDVQAIVAYLRTVEAVENSVPERELAFPLSMIIKTVPAPAQPLPEPANSVEHGKYLVTIGACAECHTPAEKGKPVAGKYLAGGNPFPMPGVIVTAANITPDPETGIGAWAKEDFIMRFKAYADSSMQKIPVGQGAFNTVMPWLMYAGMTESDLGAVYDYLMSIEPVKNPIEKFTPQTDQGR